MRMIPPHIDPDTPSDGEKLVFELLAAVGEAGGAGGSGLDTSGWTVLHSQDLAHHRRQMEGEIDFLVVAPGLGVLVVEVKGCHRLRRERGLWFYGADADGDPRGPFKQASEAMHSLRDRLARQRTHLHGVIFQSVVCFPFIDFTDVSEEWHPWQVVDHAKLRQRPITEWIAAALRQARERAEGLRKAWFDPRAAEPTPEQCEEIVRVLRHDFEFYESPKARAQRIDEQIRHYTESQFEALEHMRRMPRVVFDGPAGTGKTLLAIEAARRARSSGRRALLLCFNRPLAEWLREQTAGLCDATTVSDHMVRAAGIPAGSALFAEDGFWKGTLPRLAAEALIERPPDYDELILDEAQDVLRHQFLDVLDFSVRGGLEDGFWRIFGDFRHQAIYDDSVDLDAFCDGDGRSCVVYDLVENCRNAPAVAALACAGAGICAAGVEGTSAGSDAVAGGYARCLRPDDGDPPEVRFYRDAAQQRELLCAALQELRDAGFAGPQVAVLSTRNDAACAAAGVTEQSWRDRLTPLMRDTPRGPVADLRSNKMRYASVHRFKGLEAHAVVLTDIEHLDTPRERDLFYVGATRATQRLIVLANEALRPRLTA
jgi:DNA polymerase III delta prime subunit